ncbi:hypothetical protein KBI23_05040 [bacterium]|nr:hypothetical protein [bacterium]MBP9807262.1 hypothetical protein [bacterium]
MSDALNGHQKLEKTAECMKTGDVKCVQETLNTVQDQKIFMDLLGSKAESKGLPGLQIVDSDKDGHTDAVKVTAGKNQMSIDLKDGNLSVTDNSPTLRKTIGNAFDYVGDKLSVGMQAAKDAVNSAAPVENINRANTTDSDQNRRWDSQLKKAGG